MKEIQLIRLAAHNFKGLRDFTLEPDGKGLDVFGRNAAGKTTLADAFSWCLFGKDSAGQTDFEIKTLTASGESLHNLEHSVEVRLRIVDRDARDVREIVLRRTYAEKWVKQRGSAAKTFSGHTTDYAVNGVPSTKAEYDRYVAEIADESVLKLLTSPTYFNEILDWKKRRALLLEVCGDVSDQDVIASDKALKDLPEILAGRSLEDHRKVVAAKRKEINQELERIPVRIDEATRALPDVSGGSQIERDAEIERLRDEISRKQEERAQVSAGGAIADRRVRMREVEAEMQRLRTDHVSSEAERTAAVRRSLADAQGRVYSLQGESAAGKRRIETTAREAKTIEERMAAKRLEWQQVNAQAFTAPEQASACPTCGQDLPHEHIESARAKAEADHNLRKAQRLEQIAADGTALKEQHGALTLEASALGSRITELEASVATEEAEVARIKAELVALDSQATPVTETPAYEAKAAERDSLEVEIERLQVDAESAVDRVKAEIHDLEVRLQSAEGTKRLIESRRQGEKRIADLEQQEKALAAEFERLEGEMFLCDQFVRAKVNLLEGRINSHFRIARFKLFDAQINGGLQEVCETTVGGVPYSSLNHGHRIAAGVDICRVLSEHYGLVAPVWLDNSESLTVPIETDAQVIRLVVSESDEVLRVERAVEKEAV